MDCDLLIISIWFLEENQVLLVDMMPKWSFCRLIKIPFLLESPILTLKQWVQSKWRRCIKTLQ